MKRTFKCLLLLALPLLASCSDAEPSDAPRELSFAPVAEVPAVKGFVTGTTLVDDATGGRPLYVSAFLHAQSGLSRDYFVGEAFGPSAGAWHADPAIFWPMGGRLDILAYSAAAPFPETDVAWGVPSAAERLRLAVGSDRLHDDILFGAAWHLSSTATSVALPMQHSQAWIDVRLALAPAAAAIPVTVTSVVLRSTYVQGDLTVTSNAGSPEYSWSFVRFEARDRIVDEGSAVYGTEITTTEKTLQMLIPEQEMRTITVNYTVGGVPVTATRELPHRNWLAGKHYIYQFTFNPVSRSAAMGAAEEPWDGLHAMTGEGSR